MNAFLQGILQVFNFTPPKPAIKSDVEALADDWKAVGSDMFAAIEQFEQEEHEDLLLKTAR